MPTGPDLSPAGRQRVSGPGLRTFLAISDLWGLNEGERRLALGNPARSTYFEWARAVCTHEDVTLPADMLFRISAVLGIHSSLQTLFRTEAEGIAWLRTPHMASPFGNRPPLDLVVNGTPDGPLRVRRFLESARQGIYMPPTKADVQRRPLTDADIVFT